MCSKPNIFFCNKAVILNPFSSLYLFLCGSEGKKKGIVHNTLESQPNIKQKFCLTFQINMKYREVNIKNIEENYQKIQILRQGIGADL